MYAMQSIWSYIKDSGNFTERIKKISNISEDAILITADVVGLYPSIPNELDLKAMKEAVTKNKT